MHADMKENDLVGEELHPFPEVPVCGSPEDGGAGAAESPTSPEVEQQARGSEDADARRQDKAEGAFDTDIADG